MIREGITSPTWCSQLVACDEGNPLRPTKGMVPIAMTTFREILLADPCCYCGKASETLEHIEPRSKGGSNAWTNLAGACSRCNESKGADSLLVFLLRRKNPRPSVPLALKRVATTPIASTGGVAYPRGAGAKRILTLGHRSRRRVPVYW